jgi:hypothetical protein
MDDKRLELSLVPQKPFDSLKDREIGNSFYSSGRVKQEAQCSFASSNFKTAKKIKDQVRSSLEEKHVGIRNWEFQMKLVRRACSTSCPQDTMKNEYYSIIFY